MKETLSRSVTLATVSMNVTFDKEKNLQKYFKFIDEAAAKQAKLLVFPEQSLQGYLENLMVLKQSSVRYQHANAEQVPDGESVQKIINKAKENDMYIIWGMTECAPDEGIGVLYNSAVLVGPEGYIGKYRKVHSPIDEIHVYFPGEAFNVFDTVIGKIGMLICYDKMFPESARELAMQRADILVMPTAAPFFDPRCSSSKPETAQNDMYCRLWNTLDDIRAFENQCFFISSNQFGVAGDHDYFGNSGISSPMGITLARTACEEAMATASVNIKSDMETARSMLGSFLLKERCPEVYKHLLQDFRRHQVSQPPV